MNDQNPEKDPKMTVPDSEAPLSPPVPATPAAYWRTGITIFALLIAAVLFWRLLS
jgi:hypothetical protein